MVKEKFNCPEWIKKPLAVLIIAEFVCIFTGLFFGRYGVKGLYGRIFNGLFAVSLGGMILLISIMFLSVFISDVRSRSIDYREYFIGFLLFLRSIAVVAVLFIFVVGANKFGESSHKTAMYTISATVISIAIFIIYVRYCRKHKSMQGKVFAILFCTITFPMIIVFGFYGGISTIVDSVSDLSARKTCNVILYDGAVSENSQSKGGTTYSLVGRDSKDKLTTFHVDYDTYKALNNADKSEVKVVCYEKSRVIENIYIRDRQFINYVD